MLAWKFGSLLLITCIQSYEKETHHSSLSLGLQSIIYTKYKTSVKMPFGHHDVQIHICWKPNGAYQNKQLIPLSHRVVIFWTCVATGPGTLGSLR